jgi:RecB family exonuclease
MTTAQAPPAPGETHPVSPGEFLAWDSDRLVVTDPEQLRKVNRPRLSASTAKAIESCPARYVSDKTFPGVDNPFAATDLGTAAHAVLERLYTLPAAGRSRLAAARATLELAEEVDFAAHFGDPSSAAVAKAQWIATVTEYYSGIWEIEDPTTVMVRRNEWPVNQVEVAGVPFIGFIDRTDVVVDEDGVMGSVPVDYKGLATDTTIPTPTGWTTMGELREGDQVLGADGCPTTVVGKSSTFHRPCYEVTFSDGASVVADNVHLWQVTDHRLGRGHPGPVVLNTDELYIRHYRCRRSLHTRTLRIANTAPLQLPECDMAGTDLYELGFSLGRDPQPDVAGGEPLSAGLRGSHQQRLALLRGLMDAAGSLSSVRCRARFASQHRGIVEHVAELVASFGITAHAGAGGYGVEFWPTGLNPFLHSPSAAVVDMLSRELTVAAAEQRSTLAHRREITSVVPVETVPTECIMVDAPDSLYLCGPTMVPTHNSGKVGYAGSKFGDPHGDQLRLYAAALEAIDGRMPATARVYYTRHARSREVSLTPRDMNRTLRHFEKSWADLRSSVHRASFVAQSSALCGWCPLVNSCPVAAREGKTARAEGLPSAVELGIPVLSPMATRVVVDEVGWDGHDADDGLTEDPFDVETIAPLADSQPPAETGADDIPPALEEAARAEEDSGQDTDVVLVAGDTAHAAHITTSTEQPSEGETEMSLVEDKPWESTGVNGELNPNSYAATAAFGLVSLATETLHEGGIKLSGSAVDALAGTFAKVVEEAQRNLTGRTSMQDGANTRLRGALHTVITTLPLPFGKDEQAWEQWYTAAVRRVGSIADAALRLFENGPDERPWATLAVRSVPTQTDGVA